MRPRFWGLAVRALLYSIRQRRVGASDEYQLFPKISLGQPTAKPLQATVPVPSAWQGLLAETKTRAFRVWRENRPLQGWDAPGDDPLRVGRLYSVTKSVLSLAWGIADAEKRVPQLDEIVHGGMTVRQLLRMDSGLPFDEGFSRVNRQVHTYLTRNAGRAARSVRVVEPVAEEFHYNDYHSLLLGVLLEEGLKKSGWVPRIAGPNLVSTWMYERLLAPLDLSAPVHFVVDSARNGFPKTESGLCLCADDLVKIGQLVLNHGVWDGRVLVPAAWLDQSTDPHLGWSGVESFRRYRNLAWGPWLSQGRGFYGWHWWGRLEKDSKPTVFAMGIHGQLLVISPKHRAVVVRLADRWSLKGWWPDKILEGLEKGLI